MPKITASTVAEHRARQRAQLLRAVVQLVTEAPAEALTLAAVGERVGLARSSVYKYFTSIEDLILAAVEEIFTRWTSEVGEAVDAVTDPLARIERFIRRTLGLVAEGEHRLMEIAASIQLEPDLRRRIGEQHRAFMKPLIEALMAVGVDDPALTASLLYGVVEAATRRIEAGAPAEDVTDLAVTLVSRAVKELRLIV